MAIGYGVTVWCTDTIRTGRFVRGSLAVAQSCYRRLITPRGMLRGSDEASAYGFDVAAFVGAIGAEQSLRALPPMVAAELRKDDRIAKVDVVATLTTARTGETAIELAITAELHDALGDFALTLSVTDAAVTLVSLEAS